MVERADGPATADADVGAGQRRGGVVSTPAGLRPARLEHPIVFNARHRHGAGRALRHALRERGGLRDGERGGERQEMYA
jgi:hypothetical protein